MPCKIVVLISGSGSNLQAIIDQGQTTGSHYQVAAVISNKPQALGLVRAQEAGIATACVEHTQFDSRESFDIALSEVIDQFQPDLVVLAGFMRILTPDFVRRYLGRLLNIHPSLLPKYPGLHTHQRAIDAGDSEAGATVHFVTEELDGGPPVLQAKVPILPGDSAETLANRVLSKEHLIYPAAVNWFAQGKLTLRHSEAFFDDVQIPASGLAYETA
ncbi:phosphoribosylglycinamide formyltransferase [Spongiibacter sp. KMU-158]|uniref:Phosphoribosylglycinamide formyltransferase n=1 Tax=Spongiibacter pelagi TaxID=2760804 RepID=A0A927BZD4_9GAMM|nr:phosphoribosylglycinamide formyltransferase [Spongiibacter pelagi]MBD2858389.1 phosphoribosylglycinamide formyltransferase [Spongiibacter pelagi]